MKLVVERAYPMMTAFKSFVASAVLILAVGVYDRCPALTYPDRPVTIVVPLPAGGASDRAARLLADHLSKAWMQPVVVENKPGSNGLLGALAVARAEPDGYTLLLATPSFSAMRAVMAKPGIDPIKDFAPISQLTFSPFILATNSGVPANSLGELIAYARGKPGKLNYGTFGGMQKLAFEYFKQMAGIDVQPVYYRGEAPMMLGLSTDEVQVTLASAVTIEPLAQAGKVKAIAVTTRNRASSTPNIPTMAESGLPNYDVSVWYGLLAPANTPAPVIRKVSNEVAAFAKRQDMIQDFMQVNYTLEGTTPDQFSALLSNEVRRWSEVGAKANIKPE
jgi:tripartite-type tricarboxylate transporter receptor subunit TctC